MTGKPPLYYTFGNHMHWVDMQWLWGYHVLPGSVDDMLRLIDETGARGNVNFDAIGYEKMAVECPEHLAKLKDAVARGLVEPVGCSYGQPYGLFHGGESNIRQLTFGVRTTRRLLGVRPRTFWEEEFYFFPQLPQMLAQCGYTGASLFFQWTWHTPEVPKEPCSLILWEGADGTRLPTLPRNELNVHQWPEDFDGLLDKAGAWANPAVVQWLELMPSKDWMCRSEVLLPRLRELMKDERFDVRPRTAGKLIEELLAATPSPPVKHYTMDDVWHGMTLGKNEDAHPKSSRECERAILEAEAQSAMISLFGRPYPRWDVYPTWELDEAWRELLVAQHHDNHECEGLCGDIAHPQFMKCERMIRETGSRSSDALQDRFGGFDAKGLIGINFLGWPRECCTLEWARLNGSDLIEGVPPFGYRLLPDAELKTLRKIELVETQSHVTLRRGEFEIEIERASGTISRVKHPAWGDRRDPFPIPLPSFQFLKDGKPVQLKPRALASPEPSRAEAFYSSRGKFAAVTIWLAPPDSPTHHLAVAITMDPIDDAIAISITDSWFREQDPGLAGALAVEIAPPFHPACILADTPMSCNPIDPRGIFRRKYPKGDWMTSPQWFEKVARPFTGHSFVDFLSKAGSDSSGMLVLTGGSQQWLRTEGGGRLIVDAVDPWDERNAPGHAVLGFEPFTIRIHPHRGLTNASRVRLARAFETRGTCGVGWNYEPRSDLPPVFGPLSVENAPNVLAHAFFRESMKSGEHLPHWAGHRMFEASGGLCDHPFVIRLVEWDGQPAEVTLKLAGPVAMAAKANLLGEVLNERPRGAGIGPAGWSPLDTGWLECTPCEQPAWAIVGGKPIEFRGKPIEWTQVRFAMRPREIATIYADMVMGRKQFRDLDAKREVWATVHKEPGKKE